MKKPEDINVKNRATNMVIQYVKYAEIGWGASVSLEKPAGAYSNG